MAESEVENGQHDTILDLGPPTHSTPPAHSAPQARPTIRRSFTKSAEKQIPDYWESFKDFFKGVYLPVMLAVFAITALQAAAVANDQSQVANQLALLSLCSGSFSSNVCTVLLKDPDIYLWDIAETLYNVSRPAQPLSENTTTATHAVKTESSSYGTARGDYVSHIYIAVLAFLGVATLYEISKAFRKHQ